MISDLKKSRRCYSAWVLSANGEESLVGVTGYSFSRARLAARRESSRANDADRPGESERDWPDEENRPTVKGSFVAASQFGVFVGVAVIVPS